MFDRPSLALMMSYATFPNLAAFAFVHWLGVDALAYLLVLFVGCGSLYAIVMQLQVEFARIQRDLPDVPAKPAYRNEPLRIQNMNEKPLYNQVTPLVKIDHMSRKIKHFCIVLITQRDDGFKVDLKEDTWKAHFGGRDNYVWVRDVKMGNAFAKEFPRDNSPFTVTDWRIVERGAEGRL